MRYFSLIALSVTSLLVPFDFILYESPFIYSSARVMLMSTYIFMLVLIFKYYTDKHYVYTFNFFILIPSLSYNVAYTYFLYQADHFQPYYKILLLATFLVTLISTLFIYKFWKEQYALTFLSILALFILSIYKPDISKDIIRLIFFHIISFVTCMYFRHQFVSSLSNRYRYMSSLLPYKYAKTVSVSENKISIEELFPTKEYYSVCLCSDWRNYQRITTESEHKDVQDMLEGFYEVIYSELSKLKIDGQYYADWTADELFIIFYGNDKQKDEISKEALRFCHNLATNLYIEISNHISRNIKYDIGIASGYGLIGLQGPGKFKKTTITGDVAGYAKRFETQAKNIRKTQGKHLFPIVVMDQYLKKLALKGNLFKTQKF
ncbi:MAG: hypothetical protein CMG00_06885, partial [Candidatus Marinimicrobia bacterium]|nr:hypothetical protein [Candidatus Neomarinimicrobiota bacterium]